ncbi:MAG: DUF4349 domain-containing protein [Chitinispirillaceae bacterium]
MRKTAFIAICLFAVRIFGQNPQGHFTITAQRVIKTADVVSLTETILDKTEAAGGYFLLQNRTMLHLKLPVAKVDSFLHTIDLLGEIILQRSYNRIDLENEFIKYSSKAKARNALLVDYMSMVEDAGENNIITIKTAVVNLQDEIEGVRGKLLKLKHQTEFADVTIYFQLPDRTAPLATGTSNFQWLNTINLSDLLWDYAQ